MLKSVGIRIDGFRRGGAALAIFLLAASTGVAFAHGGLKHVMGTVSKVTAGSVIVETTDKKVIEVGLSAKTIFTRNDKKVAASDMKVGDRLMIEAKEVDGKLVADSIKLGTAATAPARRSKEEGAASSAPPR